jgi:hypothetical protein
VVTFLFKVEVLFQIFCFVLNRSLNILAGCQFNAVGTSVPLKTWLGIIWGRFILHFRRVYVYPKKSMYNLSSIAIRYLFSSVSSHTDCCCNNILGRHGPRCILRGCLDGPILGEKPPDFICILSLLSGARSQISTYLVKCQFGICLNLPQIITI